MVHKPLTLLFSFAATNVLLSACAPVTTPTQESPPPPIPTHSRPPATMELTSPAFTHGDLIPAAYTCDGKDISPPLRIAEVPKGTESLALVSDDPDAPVGAWDHWILFNIDPTTTEITEGTEPEGSIGGINSWGRTGYGGPCPPSGTHRYFFRLYALDTVLPDFAAPPKKEDIIRAMEGHTLEQAELMGVYERL